MSTRRTQRPAGRPTEEQVRAQLRRAEEAAAESEFADTPAREAERRRLLEEGAVHELPDRSGHVIRRSCVIRRG